jgi:hypothetical protein
MEGVHEQQDREYEAMAIVTTLSESAGSNPEGSNMIKGRFSLCQDAMTDREG